MIRTFAGSWEGHIERLFAPVSNQSLAAFRVLFGALMVWDIVRYYNKGFIRQYYVEPTLLFPYEAFTWLKPLPEPYIHYAWLLAGFFAACVAIGFLFRFAIIGFLIIFTYFFLLDKSVYLNHFYMIILYSVLLALTPANRAFSIDALLWPSFKSNATPYWSVFVLRAQTEIILVYAGLVKITEDWLNLEPLGMWLRGAADRVPFGDLLYQDWVIAIGAYGTIALHLIGAPLLLIKRTRLPVFLLYCCFHMINAYVFPIGVFPWMTMAITLIFFAPKWPEQLLRWISARAGHLILLPSIAPAPAPVAQFAVNRSLTVFVCVWLAVQVLLPLRSVLYASDVRWSGEGHYFSWRMRIYDRQSYGYFEVVDPATGKRGRVNPGTFLTRGQMQTVMERPDMILRSAHYLREVFAAKGKPDVQIYGIFEVSLNGRAHQLLVRPDVDLAKEQMRPLQSEPWVTELTTPLVPWRERKSALNVNLSEN